ncbi:hypothetical protein [Streptomyces sp. LARHCF252]
MTGRETPQSDAAANTNSGGISQPEASASANVARKPDRPASLTAWGTLFLGVAALMTVCTAVATTYVAVATYQDQQAERDKKDAKSQTDFAQRVEFTEQMNGVVTIDNPNNFPLNEARILFNAFNLKYKHEATLITTPTLIPACSRASIRFSDAVKNEGKGNGAWSEKLSKDLRLQGVAATFQDREGQTWGSSGAGAFTLGETLNSLYPYSRSDDRDIHNVTNPVESGMKLTKSSRCLDK